MKRRTACTTHERFDGQRASVVLSQMRVIDTKRLSNKLGFLAPSYFDTIRKTVKTWF